MILPQRQSPSTLASRQQPDEGLRSRGGVVALLTDTAWLAMPPAPHEYLGAEAIAAFLRASARWRGRRRLVLVPARANAQPAFGCYLTHPDRPTAYPTSIFVLTMSDARISTLTRFLDADLPAGSD